MQSSDAVTKPKKLTIVREELCKLVCFTFIHDEQQQKTKLQKGTPKLSAISSNWLVSSTSQEEYFLDYLWIRCTRGPEKPRREKWIGIFEFLLLRTQYKRLWYFCFVLYLHGDPCSGSVIPREW